MAEPISNNKRIAKNTLLLYFRLILTMLVGLYTVRVVLKVLGVEDYGIYNVVGGIVTMFAFLAGTMASASQRYFAYDLGRGDHDSLKKTFSLTMLSYIFIAALVFILCEIFGVWFLNNKMTIPAERLTAANWVLQSSIISFLLSILVAPYTAVIIARERMSAYAYISILEVTLKLAVAFLLMYINFDKLEIFALLNLGSGIIITFTYILYCRKYFKESHFSYYWNWDKLKELLSYAGWNMIGAIAAILRNQGINILLNIFFNPSVNAARGVAYQVNNAISNLSQNFYTAVKPQIIKTYAVGDYTQMMNIIFKSSLFSFYLMALFIVPIYFQLEVILNIWLTEIPADTFIFTRLILITTLLEVFNFPLVSGIQATGNIKSYQLILSVIFMLNLPISYVLLKLGYPSASTMVVGLFITTICVIPRLILAKRIIKLSIRDYIKRVLLKSLFILILLTITAYGIKLVCDNIIIFGVLYLVLSLAIIYLLGINKNEKLIVNKYIHNYAKILKGS